MFFIVPQIGFAHRTPVMLMKALLLSSLVATALTASCIECICKVESGCKALGCRPDRGSDSCGYYQIKLPYYKDCGQPGKRANESVETAWKRCSNDKTCATTCVNNYYNRHKGKCPASMGTCETTKSGVFYANERGRKMARLHNGGPSGCKKSATIGYWNKVKKC